MCSVHFIDSIAINSADRSNSLSDHVLISFLCGGESSTESGSGHLICTHRQIWSGDSLAHILKQTQSTDTCSVLLNSRTGKQEAEESNWEVNREGGWLEGEKADDIKGVGRLATAR